MDQVTCDVDRSECLLGEIEDCNIYDIESRILSHLDLEVNKVVLHQWVGGRMETEEQINDVMKP